MVFSFYRNGENMKKLFLLLSLVTSASTIPAQASQPSLSNLSSNPVALMGTGVALALGSLYLLGRTQDRYSRLDEIQKSGLTPSGPGETDAQREMYKLLRQGNGKIFNKIYIRRKRPSSWFYPVLTLVGLGLTALGGYRLGSSQNTPKV